MRALRVIGAALGTVRIVDDVKKGLPWIPPPMIKSLFSSAVAAGLVYLTDERPREWRRFLTDTSAAAGGAMLLHELHWYLMASGDGAVLRSQPPPRRVA
jgi:hypothetical protein